MSERQRAFGVQGDGTGYASSFCGCSTFAFPFSMYEGGKIHSSPKLPQSFLSSVQLTPLRTFSETEVHQARSFSEECGLPDVSNHMKLCLGNVGLQENGRGHSLCTACRERVTHASCERAYL